MADDLKQRALSRVRAVILGLGSPGAEVEKIEVYNEVEATFHGLDFDAAVATLVLRSRDPGATRLKRQLLSSAALALDTCWLLTQAQRGD